MVQVVVLARAVSLDEKGVAQEGLGVAFLQQLYGQNTVWKAAAPCRPEGAAVGYKYDAGRDKFIPPQPYPSWSLDDSAVAWVAPKPMPEDGKLWQWDEKVVDWVTAN